MLVMERPGRLRIAGQDGKLSEPLEGVPEVFGYACLVSGGRRSRAKRAREFKHQRQQHGSRKSCDEDRALCPGAQDNLPLPRLLGWVLFRGRGLRGAFTDRHGELL